MKTPDTVVKSTKEERLERAGSTRGSRLGMEGLERWTNVWKPRGGRTGGKDLEVGRWDKRQQGESLTAWDISLSDPIFHPDPGSQLLTDKAGRKCSLSPGIPCRPLSPWLDLT